MKRLEEPWSYQREAATWGKSQAAEGGGGISGGGGPAAGELGFRGTGEGAEEKEQPCTATHGEVRWT